jgi:hydroxyethylthiazole kinase-like uncharacterized protein yjeF
MKILTLSVDQARDLDRRTSEEYEIPSFLLMENAGRGLANSLEQTLEKFPRNAFVIFFCGGGNNGGDGFVAARHLYPKHNNIRIYLMSDVTTFKGDALTNYLIIKKLGLPLFPFSDFSKHEPQYHSNPLVIIDAMIGLGLKGELKDPVKEAVRQINQMKKFHNAKVTVIACDIPSGVDGNEGPVSGQDAIQADITVTFACNKLGLAKNDSKLYAGKIEVVDIGIPQKLMEAFG